MLKTVPSPPTTLPPFSLLRGLIPISQQPPDGRIINVSAPEDLTFTLYRPGKYKNQAPRVFYKSISSNYLLKKAEVIQPHRMARISPIQIEAPQPDSLPDPEVLQKMNDIIKDRSAECKPRKVILKIQ